MQTFFFSYFLFFSFFFFMNVVEHRRGRWMAAIIFYENDVPLASSSLQH